MEEVLLLKDDLVKNCSMMEICMRRSASKIQKLLKEKIQVLNNQMKLIHTNKISLIDKAIETGGVKDLDMNQFFLNISINYTQLLSCVDKLALFVQPDKQYCAQFEKQVIKNGALVIGTVASQSNKMADIWIELHKSEAMLEAIQHMSRTIRINLLKEVLEKQKDDYNTGDIIFALVATPFGSMWLRAIVDSKKDKDCYKVIYSDFGNSEYVSADHMVPYPPGLFSDIPFQALCIRIKLENLDENGLALLIKFDINDLIYGKEVSCKLLNKIAGTHVNFEIWEADVTFENQLVNKLIETKIASLKNRDSVTCRDIRYKDQPQEVLRHIVVNDPTISNRDPKMLNTMIAPQGFDPLKQHISDAAVEESIVKSATLELSISKLNDTLLTDELNGDVTELSLVNGVHVSQNVLPNKPMLTTINKQNCSIPTLPLQENHNFFCIRPNIMESVFSQENDALLTLPLNYESLVLADHVLDVGNKIEIETNCLSSRNNFVPSTENVAYTNNNTASVQPANGTSINMPVDYSTLPTDVAYLNTIVANSNHPYYPVSILAQNKPAIYTGFNCDGLPLFSPYKPDLSFTTDIVGDQNKVLLDQNYYNDAIHMDFGFGDVSNNVQMMSNPIEFFNQNYKQTTNCQQSKESKYYQNQVSDQPNLQNASAELNQTTDNQQLINSDYQEDQQSVHDPLIKIINSYQDPKMDYHQIKNYQYNKRMATQQNKKLDNQQKPLSKYQQNKKCDYQQSQKKDNQQNQSVEFQQYKNFDSQLNNLDDCHQDLNSDNQQNQSDITNSKQKKKKHRQNQNFRY